MVKPNFWLHLTDTVSEWTGKITSFVMILIVGYVCYGIIMRKVYHAVYNHISIAQNLFGTYISLGAAYALKNKAFIIVDVLYRRFSVRTRAILDSITFTLFLIFLLTLLQYSTKVMLKGLPKMHFSLNMLDPVRWPTSIILPVGVLLLMLQGLSKFVRDLICAITGREIT